MEKRIKLIGEMDNSDGTFESANRIYDRLQICPTIPTCGGGGIQPKTIRGGWHRMNEKVHEIECIAEIDDSKVYKLNHKIPKSNKLDDYLYHAKDGDDYGIFKLSPRECCRLMNFRDADINQMLNVNSRTQCYKQAGNSIVVSVLVGIFSQLGIQNCKKWNDMTDEERYNIIQPGR